jgi:hypothetical protein
MGSAIPICRTIRILAFRGNRTRPFAVAFQSALDDERNGRGPGPIGLDCLLFAGHAGISVDEGATVYGFNPDGSGIAVWRLMDGLKNGDAFPGVVRDDSAAFVAAQARGLTVLSLDVMLPDPFFQALTRTLDAERKASQYTYGFPNGDGDCNCITWPERLGMPLFTDECLSSSGCRESHPSRTDGSAGVSNGKFDYVLLAIESVAGRGAAWRTRHAVP